MAILIASAVNSVVSIVSGDHPDWGALKRAVVFLADSLDKETGVARGFAMGELTEYMKNNLGMSDEYAQGLADTIIFNPSRYSPQGGQQQGANDGRGLQGAQQEWQEIGDVDVANKDWKEWAGKSLAEIPPDKRLDASYGFLYDRYWYDGVIEDINEKTGVVSFRHKGDKKPFVWFAPNADNPMQDAFYLEEPPAGVMTRGSDGGGEVGAVSPVEVGAALQAGGNAAPRYGKLVQWFLEDKRNPAVASPPFRPRSSQETQGALPVENQPQLEPSIQEFLEMVQEDERNQETQSIGGAALSGRFLR